MQTALKTVRRRLPRRVGPAAGAAPAAARRRSSRRVELALGAALALAVPLGGPPEALAGQEEERTTVWDGVYTAEQAARGKIVYDRNCGACHLPDMSGSDEARPLAGERFMQDWREDTVHTLFTRIRNLMPFDEPATLGEQAYLDSVAYILEFNGFPPGDRELAPDGLADLRIEGREGPAEVPSFALVQVVGCLTEGGAGWRLTNATRAVRTRDPSAATEDELGALGARPPGVRTFGLMNVYPDPAAHAGHRMAVKGFLIRDPAGDRINVSSLGMVAAACDP